MLALPADLANSSDLKNPASDGVDSAVDGYNQSNRSRLRQEGPAYTAKLFLTFR